MRELLDIEDVLRKVQGGFDNGDFTLRILWVTPAAHEPVQDH
ncbi:hypothetical protein [Arthrobacter sp. B2a2-09]|nr:hypothetical protein [Arthrobacter sp. B2a2-09]